MAETSLLCQVRPRYLWRAGGRGLELGARPWIMAILNLTPDSFFPASRIENEAALLTRARAALDVGADILDLGAESTRPGAAPVDSKAEQARLLPGLRRLRAEWPEALLSVDTRHGETARTALAEGADIINDVSGLEEAGLARVLAGSRCGVILMHRRGEFASMHRLPKLADPVATVRAGLKDLLARAQTEGIAAERIVLDPGFGFGKNREENFPLLARLAEFHALGRPLLAGLSRKSFLGLAAARLEPAAHAAPGLPPEAREAATLAATAIAALAGAHIHRVHDAGAVFQALQLAERVRESSMYH